MKNLLKLRAGTIVAALLASCLTGQAAPQQVWNDDFSGATRNPNLQADFWPHTVSQSSGKLILNSDGTGSDFRSGVYTDADETGAVSQFEGTPLYDFYSHSVAIKLDIASIAGVPLASSRNVFCLTVGDDSQNASGYFLFPVNGVVVRLERLIAGSSDNLPYWRILVDSRTGGVPTNRLLANLAGFPTALTCRFDGQSLTIEVTGTTFDGGAAQQFVTLPDLSAAISNWQIGLGVQNVGTVAEQTVASLDSFAVTVGMPEVLRILMIGNSYTRLIKESGHLENTFAAADLPVEIDYLTTDARSLYWHCFDNRAATEGVIRSKPWNVIILQEQSTFPALLWRDYMTYGSSPRTLAGYVNWGLGMNPALYQNPPPNEWSNMSVRGAVGITELIRDHARMPDLRRVIYWSHHGRHAQEYVPNNSVLASFYHPDPAYLNTVMKDYTANAFKAIRSYCAADPVFVANGVKLQVALAGSAFDECWHRGPNYQLTYDDWSHPDVMGTYLTSALFFEQVTGIPARDVPYAGGLDASAAAYLAELAGKFGGLPRLGIRIENQRPILSWYGTTDAYYDVERSTTLRPGDWQPLTTVRPIILLNGQTGERFGLLQTTDDTAQDADRMFYRSSRQ